MFARSLLILALLIAALAAPAPARAQTPVAVAAAAWGPCEGAPPEAALECASIAVPLDYAEPDGAQISIGLNRLPAREPEQRIGSLIVNPGGPGGVATSLIAAEAMDIPLFDAELRDRFDIVGMDPRGVGTSTPVQCDPEIWNRPVSHFPQDEAGFAALQAHTEAAWQSCLALTGPLLQHLDTVSAARDMEQVRLALGGEPLNYLGLSYGTQLGATYAELFPGAIRVMALDGALDHGQRGLAMLNDESRAYETELVRFAAWCDAEPACALHGQNVLAAFDELVATADRAPIPAAQCAQSGACRATVMGEDIRVNAQNLLLIKPPLPDLGSAGWNDLAQAIIAAQHGDASAFSPRLADGLTSELYPELAIACADWQTDITTWDDLAAYELFGATISPHTQGASQTWGILTGCMNWPVPVANPQGVWNVQGAPPILIVNATHDPSTSYLWAQLMREQIAGSVLLTRAGDGHTSTFLPEGSATRAAITHYLLTGETPPPNTVYVD
ncbi:MAG: alpha/beta hydrolase [Thermomicrobiales bacterium]